MRKGIVYYPWYKKTSLPIVGGGFWGSGYTNQPLVGEYSSDDPSIVLSHVKLIKSAGFDFIYINLTSIDGPDVGTIVNILIPILKEVGLNFAFFIDSYQAINKINRKDFMNMDGIYDNGITRNERLILTLDWIFKFSESCDNYEKIESRPLVYIYIARDYYWQSNQSYLLTKNSLKRFFTIGDIIDWTPTKWKIRKAIKKGFNKDLINLVYNKIIAIIFSKKKFIKFSHLDFDLLTWYNLAQPFVLSNFLANIKELIKDLRIPANKVSFTIMPGYDDSKLSLAGYSMCIDRNNGNFMLDFYKSIYDYNDKIYTFVSFNEWHEGTEIEPSLEYNYNYIKKVGYLNARLDAF
jgi:hypothetical protein